MTGVDSFAATAKMLVLTRRWSIHLDTDIRLVFIKCCFLAPGIGEPN